MVRVEAGMLTEDEPRGTVTTSGTVAMSVLDDVRKIWTGAVATAGRLLLSRSVTVRTLYVSPLAGRLVGGGAIESDTGVVEFACTLTMADEETSPEAEAVIAADPATPLVAMVPYPTVWLSGIVASLTVRIEVSEEVTLTGVGWIVLAGSPAASATMTANVAPLLGLPAGKLLGRGKSLN